MNGADYFTVESWRRLGIFEQRVAHYFAFLPGFVITTSELMDVCYRGRLDPPLDGIISVMIYHLRSNMLDDWRIVTWGRRGFVLVGRPLG